MDIIEASRRYEAWLGKAVPLVRADLTRKHALMRDSALSLLRGTYYRWLELWPATCPELAKAPRLLSVGDLHLENFGTWRDGEGRLVWGINDFDEAHVASYANDLVRLAASVLIAIGEDHLALDGAKACGEILDGYASGIGDARAAPFVLEENNLALRALAFGESRTPDKFWRKLEACKAAAPPAAARSLLAAQLPKGAGAVRFARRTAGTGSLGVPRFVALGLCDGSLVAREAKMRTAGAFAWANGIKRKPPDRAILAQAVRAADPFLDVTKKWVVRRLAPHCERIELADVAAADARLTVLRAMGQETANVHWGDRAAAKRIAKDLKRRKADWLYRAARKMADATLEDWKVWKKG
jgi:uncharacterized protein (DUF2252 family)